MEFYDSNDREYKLLENAGEEVVRIPNYITEIYNERHEFWPFDRLEFEAGGKVLIGEDAFSEPYGLSIKEIDFADSVVCIDDVAFYNERFDGEIEELKLPEGLKSIGMLAFSHQTKLKRLYIPDSVQEIGTGCFNNCDSLQIIECSQDTFDLFFSSFNSKRKRKMMLDYLLGKYKCTSGLGKNTLRYVTRNQKELIDYMISTDNDIALGTLLSLPFKADLKYIDSVICKATPKVRAILLDYLNRNDKNEKEGRRDTIEEDIKPKTLKEWKKVYKLTNIGKDEVCVGPYKEYETSVTIPEMMGSRKVTKLEKTFTGKTDLIDVYLPSGLKAVGVKSFEGCKSLTQLLIPNQVESIEEYAFIDCSSLNEIVIPDGVEIIEESAFEGCTGLSELIIPDSVKIIGGQGEIGAFRGSVFKNCINLLSIKLPKDLKVITGATFMNCSSLKQIELPEGIVEIYSFAFYGCCNLERIYIPKTVEGISQDLVFSGCNKLTIYTKKGSYAEEYAKTNSIPVIIEE